MHLRLLPASVLVGLVACGARDADDSAPPTGRSGVDPACLVDEPVVEIGTGSTEWVPLTDGDDVQVVQGSQGGEHIVGAVRATHTGRDAHLRFTIELGGAAPETWEASYSRQLVPVEGCTYEALDLYGFLGLGTHPQIYEQVVTMTMELEDLDGRGGADAVVVTARAPPPVE